MSLNFDTNAWYQVNVTKFPGSSLLGTSLFQDGKTGAVFYQNTNTSAKGQSWQFYPYNSSVYLLRCKDGGPNGYLAAAAGKTNTDQSDVTGNTVPILANYNVTDDSMFWTVAPWGDGTYYFSNLANGSEWRLSVMDNKLMVMDSNTLPAQSGEHYTFTSLSTIGDSRYSTVNVRLFWNVNIVGSSTDYSNRRTRPQAEQKMRLRRLLLAPLLRQASLPRRLPQGHPLRSPHRAGCRRVQLQG